MTDRRFILGGIGLALAVAASAGSAAAQASSFIVSRAVSTAPPDHRVPAFGRVILDPQGQLDINAAISGQVAEVLVLPGSAVAKGDPIATVTSPDFVFTQRSYLALLENDEQLEILRGEGNLPNYLSDARDNLRWWGMTEAQIDRLVQERRTVDRLNLLAPEDGIITEVLVQPGDMIDAGDRTMQNFIVLGRAVARMQRAATPLVLEVAVFPDLDLGPSDSLVVVSGPEGAAEDAATPPGGGLVGDDDEPSQPPAPSSATGGALMDGFNAPVGAPPPPAADATITARPQAPGEDAAGDATAAQTPSGSAPAGDHAVAGADRIAQADGPPEAGPDDHAAGAEDLPAPDVRVRLPFGAKDGGPLTLPATLVAPAIDAATQQATGLVSLDGVAGDFHLGQVLPVQIVWPASPGVWLPADAVLRQDIDPVAYVDLGEGRYARRKLTVLERADGWFRVEDVAADAKVVVRGKSLIEGQYRRTAGGTRDPDDHDHHH